MLVNNPTLKNIQDEIKLKIYDAPIDGDEYVRKNGQWYISSGGSGGSGIGLGDTVTYDDDAQQLLITSGVSTANELYNIDADPFSPAISYSTGSYVIYEGSMYKFISDHEVGAWTTTDVTKIAIGNELKYISKNSGPILYYTSQPVSVVSNAEIMRIPTYGTDNKITTDTIVLECTFANPSYITSNITWTSYEGYISFSGTCITATTANVTLGKKNN